MAALAGEYHSVVARAAAARADALGLPFLCSSAVLDALTEQPTEWVARLAPAQSHGWPVYAEFLPAGPATARSPWQPSRACTGSAGSASFLRYLPGHLSPLGVRAETSLRGQLAEAPSFVAFEGYDTVAVLAEILRSHGADRARLAESWRSVAVDGTRGQIRFSRAPGSNVWQWAWPAIQVADRDPAQPGRFRVLHTA